jgi:hypothetical protein
MLVATAVAVRLLPARAPVATPPSTDARPAIGSLPPSSPAVSSPPVATSSPAMPSPRPPAPSLPIDESLLTTRGGTKRVAGKTFRLLDGAWVDASFDRTAALPMIEVAGAAERERVLGRIPRLAPYAALGDRVVVVLDGTVYRFRPGP